MFSPPLPFAPVDEAASEPNVVVDGSGNAGTVLVLSHWPGRTRPDAPASSLDAPDLVAAVEQHLRSAPPAWHPHRVEPA